MAECVPVHRHNSDHIIYVHTLALPAQGCRTSLWEKISMSLLLLHTQHTVIFSLLCVPTFQVCRRRSGPPMMGNAYTRPPTAPFFVKDAKVGSPIHMGTSPTRISPQTTECRRKETQPNFPHNSIPLQPHSNTTHSTAYQQQLAVWNLPNSSVSKGSSAFHRVLNQTNYGDRRVCIPYLA